MRYLRLFAGIGLIVAAAINHESLLGFFGLFFLYQGLFNVNACGMGGCYGGSCSIPNPEAPTNKDAIDSAITPSVELNKSN